jgi:hypothetical protein
VSVSSIRNLKMRHAVVTRDPRTMDDDDDDSNNKNNNSIVQDAKF